MANGLFPLGRSAILRAEIDWEGDTFTLAALDATLSEAARAAMQFADELTGVLGTPTNLTGTTVLDDGIADADDVSYPDVGSGETVLAFAIYKNTGTASTSPLVVYTDENDDTTAISREGDGAAITILWSSLTTRVFRL